tara:strand:+ start:790 stop:1338 length:549 start_codon:yes stop_codon:yes gene_type:complete
VRVHRNSLRGLCAASAATVIANFNALSEDQEPVSLVPVLYEPCSVELVTPSGKNLNPDNIVINNCALRVAILQLHAEIAELLGTEDFGLRVSGGFRYRDGKVHRSASNNSIVDESAEYSQHLVDEAADIVTKGVPFAVMEAARKKTPFAYGYFKLYEDGHYHVSFPRTATTKTLFERLNDRG